MLKLIIIFFLMFYIKGYCGENCKELYSSTYSKEGTRTYPPGIILGSQISKTEVSELRLSMPMASIPPQKKDIETDSLQVSISKTEELVLPGNPDATLRGKTDIQTESHRLAQNLYEAGFINQSEFEKFSSQAETPLQTTLSDIEAPNIEEKRPIPTNLTSHNGKDVLDEQTSSKGKSSILSIWNNISTTKKMALSAIPDLGYFAFLTTALTTQDPTLIRIILPFSITYGAYFLGAIPFRIKGCLRALCSPSVSNIIRRVHTRTHTVSNFQSQFSQFTREDFRN